MTFRYRKSFSKKYKKLPPKIQQQFDDRARLLLKNPDDPLLYLHPLKGKYTGYWSINVTSDYRALFVRQTDSIIMFMLIGTHSELYG